MTVAEDLARLGGVSTRANLIRLTSRREVDAALAAGTILRRARGRYVLAEADLARVTAHELSGTLCLASAALHWGWSVKTVPTRPQVSVPRKRKVAATRARRVELRRLSLAAEDVVDGVTSRDRTLLDCLRHLPFDEALAIADSALRSGYPDDRLRALVRDVRGPGGRQARSVAGLATPLAANPFESVLRAIALGVTGLAVRPQVPIRAGGVLLGTPDLVDEHLGIILEADSFEWHGGRGQLRADANRYNAFVVHGWLVLRFAWEDVMFHAVEVAAVLEQAVTERTQQRCAACRGVA